QRVKFVLVCPPVEKSFVAQCSVQRSRLKINVSKLNHGPLTGSQHRKHSKEMSLPAATVTVTATVNPWLRILGALEKKITRHSYHTWLKPTRFSHINGNIIFVRVPNAEFRQLGEKFGDLIQEAMDTLAPEYQDVKFITAEEDPTVPPVRADGGFAPVSASGTASPSASRQQRFDWDSAAQLSPK